MWRSIMMLALLDFLFSPRIVEASEWDFLMKDIDLFEETLRADAQGQREEAQNIVSEESTELFPWTGSGMVRAERERPVHVSVVIDGETLTFRDVLQFQWFAPYVEDVASRGILSGYRDPLGQPAGLFGPGDPVTIEQLAKIAVEAAEIDATFCATGKPRNKTARQGWSLLYISCAEARGWSLFQDDIVSIRRGATRAEVVLTVLQAFGIPLSTPTGAMFRDVPASSPFAAAIESAFRDGIVSGYRDAEGNPAGRFGPGNPVTRAEIAKIVSRALEVYVR